jgi:hypothetical protein
MDPILELLKAGPLGLVAGVSIWLWMKERSRTDDERARADALQEKRISEHAAFSKAYYELARDQDATLKTALEALERRGV